MMRHRRSEADAQSGWRTALGLLLSVAIGCTGSVEGNATPHGNGNGTGGTNGPGSGTPGTGGGSSQTGGTNGNSGTGGSGGGGAVPTTAAFAPAASTLRRLTIVQYTNSVHDLLGSTVKVTTDLEPDFQAYGFASVGASTVTLSATGAEKYEAAALDAAHQALTVDTKGRTMLVGCTPAVATNDACTKTFITSFGRRAWRRPLTDAEVTRYVGVASTAATMLKDAWGGLEYAVAGLLNSPNFLYRAELGSGGTQAGVRTLNGYEVATRLSYLLWSTTPDTMLLDAAGNGTLNGVDGLQSSVQRLLSSPRARTALGDFFSDMYQLDNLDRLSITNVGFPQLTATLPAAMRTETLKVIDDIAFGRDIDYRTLLDTPNTFVNAELASLYGLPKPAGTDFVATTLPASGQRLGLLGQASILSQTSGAARSSPTRRGRFVREVLLCTPITPPPDDVDTTAIDDIQVSTAPTARERLTVHQKEPRCAACHSSMDPIGLGLENFDGIGAYRTKENGGNIDASGDLDGMAFTDAKGLAAAVKNSPKFSSCLVRDVFRYAIGHVESDGEQVVITNLSTKLASDGYRFKTLITNLAVSDGFRFAGNPD